MTDLSRDGLLARLDERAEEYRQAFLSDEMTLADLMTCVAFLDEQRTALEALPDSAFRATVDPTPATVFGTLAGCWDDADYLPWVATWGREDLDGADGAIEWAYRTGRIDPTTFLRRRAEIRARGNELAIL